MILPRASRYRCKHCHYQVSVRGHRDGCSKGMCTRCHQYRKLMGSRWCTFCVHKAELTRVQADSRQIAIEHRLAALDRGELD
jgi:hypothetical protein